MMARSKFSLSVVLTTYNRLHLVRTALRSALASQAVVEIVIVDDCSVNLPENWAVSLEQIDPRVRVIQLPENGGVSRARNRGWQVAKGSHILFLDDDDQLLPSGLNRMWKRVLRSPSVVHVGMVCTEKGGVKTGRRWPASTRKGQIWGLDPRGLLQRFFSWNVKQSAIVPIELLEKVGGFDPQFHIRQWTEIFFRFSELSAICGHFIPVYQLNRDPIDRLTAHKVRRQEDFEKLIAKHSALLDARLERRAVLEANHDKMMARK